MWREQMLVAGLGEGGINLFAHENTFNYTVQIASIEEKAPSGPTADSRSEGKKS